MSTHAVPVVHDLAGRNHRVVTRAQLLDAGISATAIKTLLRNQHLSRAFPEPLTPAIYVAGIPELDRPSLIAVGLALAREASMTSHRTAAEIRGHLRAVPGNVHVLSRHAGRAGAYETALPMAGTKDLRGRVHVHTSASRLPEAERVDGWPAAPVPRTLVDIASAEGPVVLGWAWDEAEFKGALDAAAITKELRERRAPGNSAVRRLLAESFPATRPGDELKSTRELAIARLIAATGLPDARFNAWVSAGTHRYCLDVHFPGILAVEIDGPHHDLRRRNAADKDRDAELLAAGIPVVHFTTAKIDADLARCRAQLLRAHAYWSARRA